MPRSVSIGALCSLTVACLATPSAPRPQPPQARPPNIVVILADDLGWTDLGSSGSRLYETPHIDRLASRGVTLTRAYSAAPICSPTRAALLTGRSPARLHLTDWIPGHKKVPPDAKVKIPEWQRSLPHSERTLAEALAAAGYATASIGKWHLGGEDNRPEHHGFALNIGGDHAGQPPSYFSPYRIPTLPNGPPGEYVTDRLTAEAEAFIERHRDRPFFLYLPHFAVHTPLQAKPAVVEKYQRKLEAGGTGGHTNAAYAAMVESLDDSVGRLIAQLERLGLSGDTIVVFTSDNGGLGDVTSNAPLRAGKGTAYEGAVRVPLSITWEGKLRPRSEAHPVITMDLFPTLLEAVGASAGEAAIDGVSLLPILRGQHSPAPRALFWHYPHFHTAGARPFSAVLSDGFRLVQFLEDDRVELFDLANDPGEATNIAEREPARAAKMRASLDRWRADVNAQMPIPLDAAAAPRAD